LIDNQVIKRYKHNVKTKLNAFMLFLTNCY